MILPNPIEAVILDMDGTLHDTEVVYNLALERAIRKVGFELSGELCEEMIGLPGRECNLLMQAHFGPAFPLAECNQLYAEFRDSLLANSIPLKRGAVELLDYLTSEGVPVAVATSAGRNRTEENLRRSGLRHRFAAVMTRDDVSHGKPHPDVFLAAAEALDAHPMRCLAVEDSVNGIRAAHAAGMMAVMVPDLVKPTPEIRALCTHVASDLFEIKEITSKHWKKRMPSIRPSAPSI